VSGRDSEGSCKFLMVCAEAKLSTRVQVGRHTPNYIRRRHSHVFETAGAEGSDGEPHGGNYPSPLRRAASTATGKVQ
jgi:hypothetical protein